MKGNPAGLASKVAIQSFNSFAVCSNTRWEGLESLYSYAWRILISHQDGYGNNYFAVHHKDKRWLLWCVTLASHHGASFGLSRCVKEELSFFSAFGS